jgi:hypothetical protein
MLFTVSKTGQNATSCYISGLIGVNPLAVTNRSRKFSFDFNALTAFLALSRSSWSRSPATNITKAYGTFERSEEEAPCYAGGTLQYFTPQQDTR